MDAEVFLDVFVLVLGIVMVVWSSWSLVKFKNHWYDYLAMLVWGIHITIFYLLSLHRDFASAPLVSGQALHNWSVVLRLHGAITAMTLAYIIQLRDRDG